MPKEFIDEHGINYLIGQSAEDNWYILTQCKKNVNWLWFHLESFSSAYVIACTDVPTKHTIMTGATLCKEHSKFSCLRNVGVIYTELKNVKKGNAVGQAITNKTKRVLI